MKKLLLVFCILLSGNAFAQSEGTVIQPDFSDSANDYLYGATAYGVSANGEYVVGYGDEFTMSSFVWNRTSNAFQCITGAPYHTSERDRSECYAVSNSGIVVGGVETKKGYLSPGYWKDGVWTILDENQGQVSMATAISPDSRIITGQVMRTVEKTYYNFNYETNEYDYSNPQKKSVKVYVPDQWVDDVLQDVNLPSWYPDPDKVGTGIYCFHASDNGKALALNYEHPSGSRAPAAVINGKLKFFYGEQDIDVNEDTYFFFGETTNVSRNGKFFCGYFAEDGMTTVGFVYDVENDELTEVDGLPSVVLNDGTYYTANANNGQGVMGMSADGTVTCGYLSEYTELGLIPYPVIYITEPTPDPQATFVPKSITPEEGSTVDELKKFYINCSEAADYNYDNRAELLDSNGLLVTKGKFGFGDDDMTIMVTLTESVIKKGDYTLVIPYNSIGDAEWTEGYNQPGTGHYNAELRYAFTVSGRMGLSPVAISPEEGASLSLDGGNIFRLTFDAPVKVDAEKKPALKLSAYGSGLEGTIAVDADNEKVVVIEIDDNLSANKSYTLSIPAGAISTVDDSSTNSVLSFSYKTDAVEAVYDITFDYLTPADGIVAEGESLETFYLNASQDWYDKKGVATDVKFYKHGTTEEVEALKKVTYTTADYRQVKVQLANAVSATGAYDLYIPKGYLGDQYYISGIGGHANQEQTLVFYIGDPSGIDALLAESAGNVNVYDLNGRLVLRSATSSALQSLPRGIYCVGNKKFFVK